MWNCGKWCVGRFSCLEEQGCKGGGNSDEGSDGVAAVAMDQGFPLNAVLLIIECE